MRLVQKLETFLIPQNLDSKVANTCTILSTFNKNIPNYRRTNGSARRSPCNEKKIKNSILKKNQLYLPMLPPRIPLGSLKKMASNLVQPAIADIITDIYIYERRVLL